VLLDLGADVEARDADGMTPLLLAAGVEQSAHALARLLLERGADVNARTPDGRTARDIAAARVVELDARPDQAPGDPGQAASRRLQRRSACVTLSVFDAAMGFRTPPPDPAPALPEPVWLGYRRRRRSEMPYWADRLETQHIRGASNYGHVCWTDEANAAACYASEEAVPGCFEEDGEIHVYRAIPLLFGTSGVPSPIDPADLIGAELPPPREPDLRGYTRLGYDVTECNLPNWLWPGCSPLSPWCNGMAANVSALVNGECLVDDQGTAHDLAVQFGISQPEPGPYLVVEVWRRKA
jgi:hypothetical protein